MLQRLDFNGKTALITGASFGIGLATAKKMADYGATVILAARTEQKIEEAAKEISAKGQKAFAIVCDVTSYQSFCEAVELAIATTGRLDFLVNNAGVIDPMTSLVESDPDEWVQAVEVNYKGVYFGLRAALPYMLKQNSGTVVNISSGAADKALHGWSHYCSSKAAAKMLTKAADQELQGSNVNVVGLSPGTVATPMMEKIREAKINPVSDLDWSVHISPDWVAEGIAFLCGDGGREYAGTDFTLKTNEGRKAVGLPLIE
ncbi:MAG: SDR family oxidoreductase [Gammaproteobacteria bacterium]|nr:SDR family oxidoreductase [Gammaproteobacteria bacterium]